MSVAHVSLEGARRGDAQERRRAADAIARACQDTGFLLLTGHGVPVEVLRAVHHDAEAFFRLPLAKKLRCVATTPQRGLERNGYSALLSENSYAAGGLEGMPNDCVEGFNMDGEVLDDRATLPLPESPALRSSLKRYTLACAQLSELLIALIELAMGVEPGFLQARCHRSRDYLRLLRYPGFTSALPHRQGIGTHTDAGLFTLISCAGGAGLELLRADGEWVGVRPESVDQLSVNIGDALMQWCNGVWRSTEHRVSLSEAPRRSVAFFKMVNDDAVVAPLPQFCVDQPPRYPPVVFQDHIEGTLSHPAVP